MDPRFKSLTWLDEEKQLDVANRVARKISEAENSENSAHSNDSAAAAESESDLLASEETTESGEPCSSG